MTCFGRIELPLIIFNELTNSEEIVTIDALIRNSEYEIIIGRPTIRKHGLLVKCHNHFFCGIFSTAVFLTCNVCHYRISPGIWQTLQVRKTTKNSERKQYNYNVPTDS